MKGDRLVVANTSLGDYCYMSHSGVWDSAAGNIKRPAGSPGRSRNQISEIPTAADKWKIITTAELCTEACAEL